MQGGGRRLTVDELEEDKVSIPKFIFADVEVRPGLVETFPNFTQSPAHIGVSVSDHAERIWRQ